MNSISFVATWTHCHHPLTSARGWSATGHQRGENHCNQWVPLRCPGWIAAADCRPQNPGQQSQSCWPPAPCRSTATPARSRTTSRWPLLVWWTAADPSCCPSPCRQTGHVTQQHAPAYPPQLWVKKVINPLSDIWIALPEQGYSSCKSSDIHSYHAVCAVCAVFVWVQMLVWLPVVEIVSMCTHADACDWTEPL